MVKTTHTLAWLLLLLTLGGTALTSCGDTAEKPSETVTAAQTAESVSEDTAELTDLEKRQKISDNLPEHDYGGKEFRVFIAEDKVEEIWTEEQTGDSCNDAIYARDAKIEERFNCKITAVSQVDNAAVLKQFSNIVLGGADDAELFGYWDYMAYTPIGAGLCMNWCDIPNVDLSQPWHNALANDSATINGKLYAICSDLSLSSMTFTYGIFVNTKLAANYDMPIDTLYQLVEDGKWTIDAFTEATKNIYTDTNGDGKKDEDDLYGFGYCIINPADVWLTAFGQSLTSVNEDGTFEITVMTDKTESALEKVRSYQNDSDGFYKYSTQYDEELYFCGGTLVFAPLRMYAAFKALREMKDTYSIIPYPKWDEEQEQYYTNADDKFTVFSVPMTVSDTEFVGTIYEAMSAESYKTVYPTYYDVALKGKYSSDENTAKMIDIIMSGRLFDVSFQYGENYMARLPYLFRDLLTTKSTYATKFASAEKSMAKKLDKFYALYFED